MIDPNDMATFTITPTVRSIIEMQKQTLERLLDDYPRLLAKEVDAFKKECREQARLVSDGDREIEESLFNSSLEALSDTEDMCDFFYQAMFIICFSYYESIIDLIAREKNLPEDTKTFELLKKLNIVLGDDAQNDLRYLKNVVRILRRNIAHHNEGAKKNDFPIIKAEVEAHPEDLQFIDGKVIVLRKDYILHFLEKEYRILIEIADKAGFKKKRVVNGKPE